MTLFIPSTDEICDVCGDDRRCLVIHDIDYEHIASVCHNCINELFEEVTEREEES